MHDTQRGRIHAREHRAQPRELQLLLQHLELRLPHEQVLFVLVQQAWRGRRAVVEGEVGEETLAEGVDRADRGFIEAQRVVEATEFDEPAAVRAEPSADEVTAVGGRRSPGHE